MEHKTVEISRNLIEAIGLPTKYLSMDMRSDLALKEVMDPVVRYTAKIKRAKDEGIGVLLIGPSPCGRTFWLSYLARYAVVAFGPDASVRYATMQALTTLAFSDDTKYVDIVAADFLCIDDIDASANAGSVQVLTRVLRERSKHGRVTWSATSLSEQDVRTIYGAPIWKLLTTDALRVDCPGIGDRVASLSASKIRRFLDE